MQELLDEVRKYSRIEVAYKTGVSLSTLNNLLAGNNTNPTIHTLNALRKFVDEKAAEVKL